MTTFKQFNFESDTINEVERSIVIYGSTNDKDRAGDIIEPTAFQIDKIQTLPILFNHDSNQAIGKSMWAKITDKGLQLKIYISDKTQIAKDVWELVKEGIITFASVGFIGLDFEALAEGGRLYKSVDLIETSLTPTPCNSGAILLALKSIQSPELINMFENQLLVERVKTLEEKIQKMDVLTDNYNQLNEAMKQIEIRESDRLFKEQKEIEINRKYQLFNEVVKELKNISVHREIGNSNR